MNRTQFLSTVLASVFVLGLVLVAAPADAQLCAQVITFAENPETGECVAFPTPCHVPDGWAACGPGPISMAGGEACIQVITYAKPPGPDGECQAFPTPCDVPNGWQTCDPPTIELNHEPCIQVITYAKAPGPNSECQAFPTPCDVPQGWQTCEPATIG